MYNIHSSRGNNEEPILKVCVLLQCVTTLQPTADNRIKCTNIIRRPREGKNVFLVFSHLQSLFSPALIYVLVMQSLKSGSPKEACCHLICSDIIRDFTVSCGLWASWQRAPSVWCHPSARWEKKMRRPASCSLWKTNLFHVHSEWWATVNSLSPRKIMFRQRTLFICHTVTTYLYLLSATSSLLDQCINLVNICCSFHLFSSC